MNKKSSPLKLSENTRTSLTAQNGIPPEMLVFSPEVSCWLNTRHYFKKGYKIEDCIKSYHCSTFLFSQTQLLPILSWLFSGKTEGAVDAFWYHDSYEIILWEFYLQQGMSRKEKEILDVPR